MAIQVINDPYRNQEINDSTFGGALATGLGSGIRRLAENKLQQMNQRNQFAEMSRRLEGLGLNPQEAQFAATLPPKEQLQLFQMIGLSSPAVSSGQMQQVAPSVSQGTVKNNVQKLPNIASDINRSEEIVEKQPNFIQKLGQASSRASQLKQFAEENKDYRKASLREQHELAKESKQVYKDALKAGHTAKDLDAHLDRMERLVKKEGGLPVAAFRKLFKKIESAHVPHIPFLEPLVQGAGSLLLSAQEGITSPNTAEFEKLSTDLIRGAKEIFGSRVTDADLQTFLKIIPSLDQTDASKLRVIKNMRTFNQAARLKSDAAKRIIKENGGLIPFDIEQQIEDEVGDKLDKVYSDFVEGNEEAEQTKQLLPFSLLNSQVRQF